MARAEKAYGIIRMTVLNASFVIRADTLFIIVYQFIAIVYKQLKK